MCFDIAGSISKCGTKIMGEGESKVYRHVVAQCSPTFICIHLMFLSLHFLFNWRHMNCDFLLFSF